MIVYDLLTDPIYTVFAVDCRVDYVTKHLEVGALWLDPLIQDSEILLQGADLEVRIELPPELLHQPNPRALWQVQVPLFDDTSDDDQ